MFLSIPPLTAGLMSSLYPLPFNTDHTVKNKFNSLKKKKKIT